MGHQAVEKSENRQKRKQERRMAGHSSEAEGEKVEEKGYAKRGRFEVQHLSESFWGL